MADVDHQTVTQVVDCNGSDEVGVNLRRDSRYALLADAGTSFITATVVDPDLISVYRLPAYTYEELVAMDRPLSLPVVEFSADGAELLPVAQLQLEQLARFLSAHPQAVAELMVDVPGLMETDSLPGGTIHTVLPLYRIPSVVLNVLLP